MLQRLLTASALAALMAVLAPQVHADDDDECCFRQARCQTQCHTIQASHCSPCGQQSACSTCAPAATCCNPCPVQCASHCAPCSSTPCGSACAPCGQTGSNYSPAPGSSNQAPPPAVEDAPEPPAEPAQTAPEPKA
jgi:hypothetical protein